MFLYKLCWTLLSVFIYCLGSEIICPFIDSSLLRSNSVFLNSMLHRLAEFSGGRFDNASIFALGIGPYINASILMSALFKTSDYLMNKKKYEDPNIITRYTKWATLPMAIWQSAVFVNTLFKAAIVSPNIFVGINIAHMPTKIGLGLLLVQVLVTNTMLLTWICDFVTEKGIGQGSSVIIATGIFHHAPKDLRVLLAQKNYRFAIATSLFLVAVICLIESSYRQLPLVYYKGRQTRGQRYNIHTTLPLKFNPAGILPIIFASQISANSVRLMTFLRSKIVFVERMCLVSPEWLSKSISQTGPLIVSMMLIGFCYLYLDVFGSPEDLAKHLHNRSGVIENKRPGKQTQKYITKLSSRLALFGGFYLAFMYHFTRIISALLKISFSGIFNSGSTMICVMIVMEIISQLSSSISSTLYMRKRTLGKNIL